MKNDWGYKLYEAIIEEQYPEIRKEIVVLYNKYKQHLVDDTEVVKEFRKIIQRKQEIKRISAAMEGVNYEDRE